MPFHENLSHASAKKKTKSVRVLDFALSLVVFKWHRGSEGVKAFRCCWGGPVSHQVIAGAFYRGELRTHTPSIAFWHFPPKEGCRKPVLGVCLEPCVEGDSLIPLILFISCVCVCVRACVRARVWMCPCVRAYARACGCVCVHAHVRHDESPFTWNAKFLFTR